MFYAFACTYLAIGLYTAWRSPAPRGAGVPAQMKVMMAVLGIALLWPEVYYQAIRADWDDSYLDR